MLYVCIMEPSRLFKENRWLVMHLLFWLFAYCMLTYIYGTAYESFQLGAVVILLLLPVHMCYYYLITYGVLPRFLSGKYIRAIVTGIVLMASMAVLYRLTEVFITDPYIYNYFKQKDTHFTWAKIDKSWWLQLLNQGDFVNAIERSNVVVWIGVSLKLFALWHERRHAILQAELNSLKGQLHPHFLFNALNNLYALSLNNAPQTPEIILGLSNILRYVIYECRADSVSLERDIDVLQDYIRLEKLRYEERLDLNINISGDTETILIPPLLMLPLVENAFKHGAGETIDSPWINIELQVRGSQLLLKISNSKPGRTANISEKQASGIGLSNVQHRLRLLYPEVHTLKWYDEEDCFILELMLNLSNKT